MSEKERVERLLSTNHAKRGMSPDDYRHVIAQLRSERQFWADKGEAPDNFVGWLDAAIQSIEGIAGRYGWCDLNNGD